MFTVEDIKYKKDIFPDFKNITPEEREGMKQLTTTMRCYLCRHGGARSVKSHGRLHIHGGLGPGLQEEDLERQAEKEMAFQTKKQREQSTSVEPRGKSV